MHNGVPEKRVFGRGSIRHQFGNFGTAAKQLHSFKLTQ